MGCPDYYYKKVLQRFAYVLNCTTNMPLAKKLSQEDEDVLEKYLTEKKTEIPAADYFFNAGIALGQILTETDNEGCDAFNACLGGLGTFESFLGFDNNDDQKGKL